ncbi:MAG: transcriptional regulator [Bacilli bacterium]|nr:transcriptional regulator [Bacilli bacterium]
MATSENFIKYVCEKLEGIGEIRYRKMFGEYMIYINEKPIITVCDDTVFVKKLDCIGDKMRNEKSACPYKGAKEQYILDIENEELSREIIMKIEEVTPLPKKKKKSK